MAKTGLGKGLGALLGGNKPADPPASTDDEDTPVSIQPDGEVEKVVRMPINDVEPCQSQPRKDFDQQALEDLALSITANGIIQPLVVRSSDTGKHQLIAGERRWRAARIAGLTSVPVVVREATDAQVLEMALVENLQREDLNPIEEAQGYALLIDAFQLTQADAARRVGKSRAAVANSLRLLNMSEEVQTHLRQGRLTIGHAKVILGLEDQSQQNLVAERVIKENLSVRETEELVSSLTTGKTGSGKSGGKQTGTKEVHVTSLENRLKEKFGTKVSLTYRQGKGALTIKYFSDDDLERILNLLDVEA